jgi:hypothetical protein
MFLNLGFDGTVAPYYVGGTPGTGKAANEFISLTVGMSTAL